MCPKGTVGQKKEEKNYRNGSGAFWTDFSYCIFVQGSNNNTELFEVPMAIILQPISIRKCNLNTLTQHILKCLPMCPQKLTKTPRWFDLDDHQFLRPPFKSAD
jgi:hypothetical protein